MGRNNNRKGKHQEGEEAPLFILLTTYLSYVILIAIGHVRDFFGKRLKPHNYQHLVIKNGKAPLTSDFESFYTRRLYTRIRDCWNRPTTGVPGREVTVLERISDDYNKTFKLTGNKIKALNLSSYNYLGFAQNEGPCADAVEKCLLKYSINTSSTRREAGNLDIYLELERLVAKFVGKEAALISGMGFATNSANIPALIGKGSLIISDELNHSSIVFGSRLSGATVKVYKHNDMEELEKLLRESISQGQLRTHRPWKKIMVIVEGIYSMEGTIPDLRSIVELKKKYKFNIFLDEAHSIGAMGPSGRGICDLLGIDTKEIDIMMGTFTKSFGGVGGYLASNQNVIDHLKLNSHGAIYAETMSPALAQQAISAMKIVMGEDGTDDGKKRLKAIADNSVYFHQRLKEMGFIVYGMEGSPVIPVLIFTPAKLPGFSRECLKRGLAVVVVGYPATPIITSRVRFCISAAHTRKDLDFALDKISEVGDLLVLKFCK